MFFIGGIDAKQKEVGHFLSVSCPHCKESHPMTLHKSYFRLHVFFLTLWKWHFSYGVTCHNCYALAKVSSEKGMRLEREEESDLNLSEMEIFLPGKELFRKCLKCSANVTTDYKFCPACGEKLASGENTATFIER